MSRPFGRSSALLLAAMLVAACGGAASPTPAPTATTAPTPEATPTPTPVPTAAPTAASTPVPEGVLVAPGFSMQLTDGWLRLPLEGTIEDVLALLPADSQLRTSLANGLEPLLAAGLTGWAVDGTAASGITPNVNVLVREASDIPALDVVATMVSEQLAAIPEVNGIDVKVVSLAGRDVVKASYLGLGEGAEARAQGVQYTIPVETGLVIVSFTIPTNDAARLAAMEQMAAAIELAP